MNIYNYKKKIENAKRKLNNKDLKLSDGRKEYIKRQILSWKNCIKSIRVERQKRKNGN